MAKKKTTPDELDNPSTTPPPLPIETVSESEPVETAKSPKQTKSKTPAPAAESSARKKKRIVIMAGSRGGTGKTTAAVGINEFYDSLGISVKRFDFEAENKEASSFSHFYKEATRHDLRDRDSMDTLTQDMTIHDSPVIFADFGAGSQQETIAWFTRFYPRLTQRNIAFTLVGVIDGDIGATLGILEWADKTKDFPNIIGIRLMMFSSSLRGPSPPL
jgi:Mrp family chromosome partitioning ATPase